MNLLKAIRIEKTSPAPTISLTGSGGKTTALFLLARQFLDRHELVIVTATSHLGIWQTKLADSHIVAKDSGVDIPAKGVLLITGEVEGERTKPVSQEVLYWLHEKSKTENIPLLIEADGSRQKPLKAPAPHEPPIPEFTDIVIYVAGLNSLGMPLNDDQVFRAEIFSQLTGLGVDETVTTQSIQAMLKHPQGGLKNIPSHAKRVVLLNQADTPEMLSIGGGMIPELLNNYDAVIVGSLKQNNLHVIERTAGIILAAGMSSRYGQPKQLLDWKGKSFIRHVAETALRSGLEPVVVVTGFHHAEIESQLQGLPVKLAHNLNYQDGQSTSVKAGINALPLNTGAAVFLLADQPQIPSEVIRALVELHTNEHHPVIVPLVLEERRANPVLFDRDTFPDLLQLTGDVGGRAVFSKHRVSFLPWHDDVLIFDVDKPEDYERLKKLE